MADLNVLLIPGSLREASYNRKIITYVQQILTDKDVHISVADLKKLEIPIYNKDIETAGMPEGAVQFKKLIENADLIIISTPEYNHSIPAGLKNAIDWASRNGNSFKGKVAAVMGASNGLGGTIRSQEHLRVILAALNVLVIPYPEVLIRKAGDLMDESGNISDTKTKERIEKLVNKAIHLTRTLKTEAEV